MLDYPATIVFILLVLGLALEWRKKPHGPLFYFMAIWAIYLCNFRWRGSGDVAGASLLPFTLLQHGTIYLDQFSDTFLADKGINWIYPFKGHLVSVFSSGTGFIVTPFYALNIFLKTPPTDLLIHQLQKIGASCFVAGSAIFIYLILLRSVRKEWAFLLTIAYAFGTASWSTSSQAIWQHGPSQFLMSAGLYALIVAEDALFLAGFALAMAVWCRYTDIVFYIPIWLWLVFSSPRKALRFSLGSVLPVIALLADNVLHSGHFLITGHHMAGVAKFGTPFSVGLAGLLISPGRGLLLFSPFFTFAFIGMAKEVQKPTSSLYRYLALGIVLQFCFFAPFYDWGGGWCYGPRTLADVSPLLILFIPPLVSYFDAHIKMKRLFQFAIGYSILMHGMGAFLTWWWEDLPDPFVWKAVRYPPVYLLGHLTQSNPQDQFFAAWGMIIILAIMTGWFAKVYLKQDGAQN